MSYIVFKHDVRRAKNLLLKIDQLAVGDLAATESHHRELIESITSRPPVDFFYK